METITLLDLGPIIASVLGPMLAFVVVSMRYQHRDSTKTREALSESEKETRRLMSESEKETRRLITESNKETRDLMSESEKETRKLITESNKETRDLIERRHSEVVRSLGNARERLARIEGHLRIGAAPPNEDEGNEESSAAA